MRSEPGGAPTEIVRVARLVANAGKADELLQLRDEARTLPASISDSA